MIENIRKFRIVIIVGLVLVAAGLVLGLKDDILRGGAGGLSVLRIDGRTYHEKEYNILGAGAHEIVMGLAGSGDFMLYMYAQALGGDPSDREAAAERFFTNRILLRRAAEEYGIKPGDEEVAAQIRSMRAFAGGGEGFDEKTYRNFIERGIGRLGMTENDFLELISDYLAFDKIREITGPGLAENRDAVRRLASLESQRVSGELASLAIDGFEAAVEPTDDQLKEYWETLRDSFTTEEERKFTYMVVTPKMPEEDPEADAVSKDDASLSEEEKKKRDEEKAKKAAEIAEARRAKQVETDKLVDDFSYQLEEQKGSGFEELVAKFSWEVQKTDFFHRGKAPKALDVDLRSSSRGGKAVDELFRIEPTSDPLSRISQPIAIGENAWLVARLDEVLKPREKTFEEAKEDARLKYVKEKAAEQMKKKAEESIASIRTAMAAGKSFADAAKEAGLSGIKTVEKIGADHQPDAATEPGGLYEAGRYVTPGELAEPIVEADRAFVFLVTKREVVKEADPEAAADNQVSSSAMRNQYAAFNDWLGARLEAAKVERLNRN